MPEVKPAIETFAKIKVIGVGGSGGSAVNRMIKSKIKGVEFISANTDVQALANSAASTKIILGKSVTRGLGAGMDPEKGKAAAEESLNEIKEALKGADMVFVTCGMGGGTGSGAAPIIADVAKSMGALTIAVVTKPFTFEGRQRTIIADKAFGELSDRVDSIISIPNDRILQVIDRKATLLDAFESVDNVLHQGVQGISEVITVPGLINVDFADVKSIMNETGSALMGIGNASGENRAVEAAKRAIASPLLDIAIDGAKGILFTIAGGPSLGMMEVAEAARIITESADPDAKVIFGTTVDDSLGDEVRICVIATGFDSARRKSKEKEKEKEVPKEKTYSPNPFLNRKEEMKREPEPEREPEPVRKEPEAPIDEPSPFMKKPLASAVKEKPAPMASLHMADDDKEDLEIPTFLRRKLGK